MTSLWLEGQVWFLGAVFIHFFLQILFQYPFVLLQWIRFQRWQVFIRGLNYHRWWQHLRSAKILVTEQMAYIKFFTCLQLYMLQFFKYYRLLHLVLFLLIFYVVIHLPQSPQRFLIKTFVLLQLLSDLNTLFAAQTIGSALPVPAYFFPSLWWTLIILWSSAANGNPSGNVLFFGSWTVFTLISAMERVDSCATFAWTEAFLVRKFSEVLPVFSFQFFLKSFLDFFEFFILLVTFSGREHFFVVFSWIDGVLADDTGF